MNPTKDETRNGWTKDKLNEYITEREQAQLEKLDPAHKDRRVKPDSQNHRYRPHRWRG